MGDQAVTDSLVPKNVEVLEPQRKQHDWKRPPPPGNIWRCKACGACITFVGDDPISHPYYSTPRPTPEGMLGRFSPVLDGHDVACPCGCIVCCGEYALILQRLGKLAREQNLTSNEHALRCVEAAQAWEEERQRSR